MDANEIVAVKGGHIIDESLRLSLRPIIRDAELPIADSLFVAPISAKERSESMLYFNHSCEPNCGFMGNVIVVAMRAIARGEELTVDYAMCWDRELHMRCTCRLPTCRGVITGADWRRPDLQERYGEYFSSYLLTRIRHQKPKLRAA